MPYFCVYCQYSTQGSEEDGPSRLFQTMEEVCDIVCKASTGDLMSMFPQSYQRLQYLLALRCDANLQSTTYV